MPAFTKPLLGRGDTSTDLKLALGAYVRELRERRGMTQADLAKAVGLRFNTAVSAIEVGRNTIPPERYLDFANALGVNPRTFMRRVLQLTNPWAFALLFSDKPEDGFREVNKRLRARSRGNEPETIQ